MEKKGFWELPPSIVEIKPGILSRALMSCYADSRQAGIRNANTAKQ